MEDLNIKRSNIKVVLLDLDFFSFLNLGDRVCDGHTCHSHRSYNHVMQKRSYKVLK